MNIVLYVADALRADHCSCYDYYRETTPSVDDLAADGFVADSCFCQATWTRASAATLLTGCYPTTHKTETRSDALSRGVPYLPEILSDAGYETLGVSTMANVSTPLGFDRGFDEFVNLYKDETVTDRRSHTTNEEEQVPEEESAVIAYPRAADVNEAVIPWLSDRPETDCFVLVWAIDPHDPYDPPPEFEQYLDPSYDGPTDLGRERETVSNVTEEWEFERLRDLYDCEIQYMDSQIGSFVESLRDMGQYDETTFLFTGDHGESFGEREWYGAPVRAHNTPPFDERLHVPLVVKPATSAVDQFVPPQSLTEHVDIAPSILTSAGLSHDEMQGTPITDDHDKTVVFSKTQQEETYAPYYSARTRDAKLIEFERPAFSITPLLEHPRHWLEHWTHRRRWYHDLEADPGERVASTTDPSDTESLRERLDEWRERTCRSGEQTRRTESGEDESVEEQLDALGYIE